MRLPSVLAAAAIVSFLLAGCSASGSEPDPTPSVTASPEPSAAPTPEPTETAAELTIGPEGLGDLRIGEPVPADTSLVRWDPRRCVFDESEADPGPDAGRWVATIPDSSQPESDGGAFGVSAGPMGDPSPVSFIQVTSADVPTDRGIHVGSTVAEVEAAYPEAVGADQENGISRLYSVAGDTGQLVLEVASDTEGYWSPEQRGKVFVISAIRIGTAPFSVAGSDYVAGGCL